MAFSRLLNGRKKEKVKILLQAYYTINLLLQHMFLIDKM